MFYNTHTYYIETPKYILNSNDNISLALALHTLLEEEFLSGNLDSRYRRQSAQIHKRSRDFGP